MIAQLLRIAGENDIKDRFETDDCLLAAVRISHMSMYAKV